MKKIIIILLLVVFLFPKVVTASAIEIQILETRIQILQLQIKYLIALLSELNVMTKTQQTEIEEIKPVEVQKTIKPIIEEEVKEEIKHQIIPLPELECPGKRACA